MVQRSGWLLDSPPRIFASQMFIWIVVSVSVLIVLPVPASANHCLVGGVYLNITTNGTTIVNAPENLTLQDVGEKSCGFQITERIFDTGCENKNTVQFMAVDVKQGEAQFCNFWKKNAICVCQFFGCNSVSGVFYDTVMDALVNSGRIEGVDYSTNYISDVTYLDSLFNCMLDQIESAYKSSSFTMLQRKETAKLRLDKTERDWWKSNYPTMYPNQTAVDKLLQLEISLRPTTTSTTTLPPPTFNPDSPNGPDQQNSLNSGGGAGKDSDKKSGMEKSGIIAISVAVVCVLLVVMIILGVFFFMRRARKKDDDSDNKGELVIAANLYMEELGKKENLLTYFYTTFKTIHKEFVAKKDIYHEGDTEEYRYKTVHCIEATRVLYEGKTFIHANTVKLCDGKEMIALQGALKNTAEKTWKMLIAKKCSVVVMLCQLVESGDEKCAKYFPETVGEVLTFSSVKVTCTERISLTLIGTVRRKIQVETAGQPSQTVDHFQYMEWVDHKSPPEPIQIIGLMKAIQSVQRDGLVAVHCSAGVGRTGTLIGLHEAIAMLEKDHKIDTEVVLTRLREARYLMVQTKEQFVMLNVVLAELLVDRGLITHTESYGKVMAAWEEHKKNRKEE